MAGAGFKTFNTGDVLTASDVNTYLMQQTVMVFADASARSTALGANVAEGMISYLKDTNAVEVYDGANWVSSDDPNAIQNTIVDAKGDIITATAADTPARLAVGNNGETLVADSSATTGLRWQGNFAAGKNKIINGDFGIWQRGTSFSGTNQIVYTADRWQLNDFGGQTSNVARSTFTAGTAPVAGYEGQYFATWSRGGAGTASSYLTQKIEDVRTFAGQTVTFSFWAKATATEVVDFYIDQNFGSGGSATVGSSSTSFTLTTSWVRYSVTVTLASISGKTIGSSSFLAPTFQVQTSQGAFTIDLWGVQLEAGSTVTQFQTATGTIQGELAACQRYYIRYSKTGYGLYTIGGCSATGAIQANFTFPVTMRTTPSSTLDLSAMNTYYWEPNNGSTPTSITAGQMSADNCQISINKAATFTVGYAYFLYSNNTTGYIGFSAEL